MSRERLGWRRNVTGLGCRRAVTHVGVVASPKCALAELL